MASDIYNQNKKAGSMYRERAGWEGPPVVPRRILGGISVADRIAAGLLILLFVVLVSVFVFVLR